MSSKEVANAFRWYRALSKHRAPNRKVSCGQACKIQIMSSQRPLCQVECVLGAARELAQTTRYTNFSLQHAWEKFDCQTQLLTREAFVPLMKRNPEVFDSDIANFSPVYFSLMKPSGNIYPEGFAAARQAAKEAELAAAAEKSKEAAKN